MRWRCREEGQSTFCNFLWPAGPTDCQSRRAPAPGAVVRCFTDVCHAYIAVVHALANISNEISDALRDILSSGLHYHFG